MTLSAPGALAPRPGAAPLSRMVLAQAGFELKLQLRNGEQLLVTLVIPLLLLLGLTLTSAVDVGTTDRIDAVAPGILALAVMSSAFTSQAISTGFERRYGVLKRLGTTPLPRAGLITAKTLAVVGVELVQVVLLAAVALLLGWHPSGDPAAAVLLVVLGTAAFSGLALLMAGTLRAEATLAGANLVWLLMLAAGGVVVPLDRYPQSLQGPLELLPLGALSEGLRQVLVEGAALPGTALLVLLVWAAAGIALAARFFRWE
ncbi:MAG: ABC transporter permease [Motilibacteraceae bacterium]